jgi:hypothetical protein
VMCAIRRQERHYQAYTNLDIGQSNWKLDRAKTYLSSCRGLQYG